MVTQVSNRLESDEFDSASREGGSALDAHDFATWKWRSGERMRGGRVIGGYFKVPLAHWENSDQQYNRIFQDINTIARRYPQKLNSRTSPIWDNKIIIICIYNCSKWVCYVFTHIYNVLWPYPPSITLSHAPCFSSWIPHLSHNGSHPDFISFCPRFNICGKRCDIFDFKSGIFCLTWSPAPSVSLQTTRFHFFFFCWIMISCIYLQHWLFLLTQWRAFGLIWLHSLVIVNGPMISMTMQASLLCTDLIPSSVIELHAGVIGLDHLII